MGKSTVNSGRQCSILAKNTDCFDPNLDAVTSNKLTWTPYIMVHLAPVFRGCEMKMTVAPMQRRWRVYQSVFLVKCLARVRVLSGLRLFIVLMVVITIFTGEWNSSLVEYSKTPNQLIFLLPKSYSIWSGR